MPRSAAPVTANIRVSVGESAGTVAYSRGQDCADAVPAVMRRVNPGRRAQPAPAYLITVIMRARMLTVVIRRVIGRRCIAASRRVAPNIVAPGYHRLLCQGTQSGRETEREGGGGERERAKRDVALRSCDRPIAVASCRYLFRKITRAHTTVYTRGGY